MNYDAWDKCLEKIMALPREDQIIMSLRFVHGMTPEEIAATLNIELGTAITRLSIATDKCRPELV